MANDTTVAMATEADTTRTEILTSAAEALMRLAPDLPGDAVAFLRLLHAGTPTPELAIEAPEALATAAASLFAFALQRAPQETKVRIIPPGAGQGSHAVVEVVTDDMPFLVDSALATLVVRGRAIRGLLHPVLRVRRSAEGRLEALDLGGAAESMMRIALGPATSGYLGSRHAAAEDLTALEAALSHTMAEVRVAVGDFPAMLALLTTAEEEVAGRPGGEEDAAFLRWLAEDNFVLLGHRRLMLSEDGRVRVAADDNLGLLRDEAVPVFDVLRNPDTLQPAVRAALVAATPVVAVAKANMRATVHRPQHADVIFTRLFDANGRVAGIRLFYGLFAAAAYNRNPRSIPLLREKVERILAQAGKDPNSHDGRALRNILDTWPRDELFQAPEIDILAGAQRALDLAIRPRAALSVRHDPFERFVSAIVWLPRDTFDTRLRERVAGMLARAYGGRLSAYYISLGDAPLARVHYILATVPGAVPRVDERALEAAIAQASRSFRERIASVLAEARGEAPAAALLARWGEAFPPAYREAASAAQGVADLELSEHALSTGRPTAQLSRSPGAEEDVLTLRLANPGGPLPLADALPVFESLDLRAIEEVPHRLTPTDAPVVVLHIFSLRAGMVCPESRFPSLLDALAAIQDGRADADAFNRLVLRAGLDWRECWLLRAMYRWMKQVGFGFAQESVQAALAAHPDAARVLVDMFHARFSPRIARDADREAQLRASWATLLDAIANPDEDRILSRLMTLLDATVRTNFFQDRDYLALKIDSAAAGEMPAPRPWREIFVHSPRMEGCHLRAGPVARGGIRWSDRREDFRTEILGLMKAQRLKNVIIVPTGAKGGFVLKHPPPPSDREAFQAEGVACYRTLIRGMLDLTDNYVGTDIVTAEGIVRRDGDDPYIVAAADKGTATFSDLANGLAAEYGFWLGDAFASGGSAGYDHKGMGITARGAWVMIDRHFQETLGHGVQDASFTCAGVGDMSGDVFGNGLLVSRKTRLLAAFDHRHIFLDPDPDPTISFAERERLFALPRSSWADYDTTKISRGGGVHPRSAKTIALTPEARAMLGITDERAEPTIIMKAILRAPVDLLYFGGIGTYVKGSAESQAEAGDRANDAIRVDGRDVRARVVGEGANLGVTQAGRIEIARQGLRINTDALDNSAGVSTSDHEVNIKILLATPEREGRLTRRHRDDLLREMTTEVGELVLGDNAAQSVAVTLEAMGGAEELPAHAALMLRLESAGLLDRAVAGLPDEAMMSRRVASGDALTRPELAALLPFAKLWLNDALEDSALPDDPALAEALLAYFPSSLRERFPDDIARHRLRRQLLSTIVANAVANQLGCAALARLTLEAEPIRACRAAILASEAFGLAQAAGEIDAAAADAETRLAALLALRRLQESAARDLLACDENATLGALLDQLRPGLTTIVARETAAVAVPPGLPQGAAALAMAAPRLVAAPAIVRLAQRAGVTTDQASDAWTEIGRRFGLDALRAATASAAAPGPFGPRARVALIEDLFAAQSRLATKLLMGAAPDQADAATAVQLARDVAAAPDLAAVTVATRALAALA